MKLSTGLLTLCIFLFAGCRENLPEQRKIPYTPETIVMPDTVTVGETFAIKASITLDNGCQSTGDVFRERNEQVIKLGYSKKRASEGEGPCPQSVSYFLDNQQFTLNKTGTYEVEVLKGTGAPARTYELTVVEDQPKTSYRWGLSIVNGALSDSMVSNLVLHATSDQVYSPQEAGLDTANHYDFNLVEQNLASVALDGASENTLYYSVLQSQKPDSVLNFKAFSPHLVGVKARKGIPQVIYQEFF